MGKRKATSFLVLTKDGDSLTEHYRGPDKKKAREVAAKLLGRGMEVLAVRGTVVKLDEGDLEKSLPTSAF